MFTPSSPQTGVWLVLLIYFMQLAKALTFRSDYEPIPVRYSSRDAASIISNRCAEKEGLLIITADASGRGGGSKHDGLAAVLRVRHGVNKTKIPLENGTKYHQNDLVDLIHTVTRRRAPKRRDSSNEVAAISLGIKRAMQVVPRLWREKVVIISDCESALRFYCNNATINGGETHRRILSRLMAETCHGVYFTKIRSSSRSISMMKHSTGKRDDSSVSWEGSGFVDHDAADYLSATTRSIPNNKIEIDSDESRELEQLFRAVPQLCCEDIVWLENSDHEVQAVSNLKKGSWNKITVRGSEARNDQRKRYESKQKRIKNMLGIRDF